MWPCQMLQPTVIVDVAMCRLVHGIHLGVVSEEGAEVAI